MTVSRDVVVRLRPFVTSLVARASRGCCHSHAHGAGFRGACPSLAPLGGHVQKEACCAWSRHEAPRTQNLSPRLGPLTADPLAQNRTRSRGRGRVALAPSLPDFLKPSASRWPKGVRMTDASRLKSIRFEVCLGWKLSNLTDNAAAQALGGRQTVSRGPRHTVSWVGRSQPGRQSIWLGGVTVASCRTYRAHSSPVRLSGPGSAKPSRGPESTPAGEPGAGRDVTAEGR